MGQRQELHQILLGIVNDVYFQPPESTKLKYPCIIYNRSYMDIKHADNDPYKHKVRYDVMVIDRDPDSNIPKQVSELRSATYSRSYVSDNLHHDVFTLYF